VSSLTWCYIGRFPPPALAESNKGARVVKLSPGILRKSMFSLPCTTVGGGPQVGRRYLNLPQDPGRSGRGHFLIHTMDKILNLKKCEDCHLQESLEQSHRQGDHRQCHGKEPIAASTIILQ
jgi:hypothetical protein